MTTTLDELLRMTTDKAKSIVRKTILDHVNELSNMDRLRAVLEHGILDDDLPTKLNNLGFLFGVACAEYPKCLMYARDCQQADVKDWQKQFEAEAKEWSRLARLAAPFLGLNPDPEKRVWYAISLFHGANEVHKNGKWQRIGGSWSEPKHGHSHVFATQRDAEVWGEMQYGLLTKWSLDRGLDNPWKVVPLGPKPGEQP